MDILGIFKNKSGSDKPEIREDMYLRTAGKGEMIHYELSSYGCQYVEWVSRGTDEHGEPVSVRIPQEKTVECEGMQSFTLGGKTYRNINHFIHSDDEKTWTTDVYGRTVLCLKNRFPCFDSYDYLYEHRYYRWFFLREGNSLHRVFVTDERKKFYVTEDVARLENDCWKKMQELGYCQQTEENV